MRIKHILSLMLVAFVTLSVTSPVFGAAIDADASVMPVIGVAEEKFFCAATMEDDFAEDEVIVVLNNIASLNCKAYSTSDFPEISCTAVEDLSAATVTRMQTRIAQLLSIYALS